MHRLAPNKNSGIFLSEDGFGSVEGLKNAETRISITFMCVLGVSFIACIGGAFSGNGTHIPRGAIKSCEKQQRDTVIKALNRRAFPLPCSLLSSARVFSAFAGVCYCRLSGLASNTWLIPHFL